MGMRGNERKINRKLNKLEDKIKKCSSQNDLARVASEVETKSDEFTSAMQNLDGQIQRLQEAAGSLESNLSASQRKSKINDNRISDLVASMKKYNLIIRGIAQEKRLERPAHLEAVVKKIFQQKLGLNVVHFDEVMPTKKHLCRARTISPYEVVTFDKFFFATKKYSRSRERNPYKKEMLSTTVHQ